AGEVEGHTIDQADSVKIQRARADVLQFDVLIVRSRVDASHGQGGGVHDFRDAQTILRRARIGRVAVGVDQASPLVVQENRLTTGGELTFETAHDEVTLAATRSRRA